jgi:hypothetical protein
MDGAHVDLFPAKASPTNTLRSPGRTGFSREGVGRHTAKWMVHTLTCSRLKPVLQIHCEALVGPASAGNASDLTPQKLMSFTLASSRLKPVLQIHCGALVGPASAGKASDLTPQKLMSFTLASSRLKPVLQTPRSPSGTGFSREGVGRHRKIDGAHTGLFPAEAGPTDTARIR